MTATPLQNSLLELFGLVSFIDDLSFGDLESFNNAQMLAAAMAKLKGYLHNPDKTLFRKQGRHGMNNYIFTTTYFEMPEYLDMLHIEMAEGEYLLICCEAFDEACRKRYKNIIVQKIPQILLGRCEFGKDNYDLNVIVEDIEDVNEADC